MKWIKKKKKKKKKKAVNTFYNQYTTTMLQYSTLATMPQRLSNNQDSIKNKNQKKKQIK